MSRRYTPLDTPLLWVRNGSADQWDVLVRVTPDDIEKDISVSNPARRALTALYIILNPAGGTLRMTRNEADVVTFALTDGPGDFVLRAE